MNARVLGQFLADEAHKIGGPGLKVWDERGLGYIGVILGTILGLHWGYIGVRFGLYWG